MLNKLFLFFLFFHTCTFSFLRSGTYSNYDKLFQETKTFDYIQNQGHRSFPVLVICYDRPAYLNKTLRGLLTRTKIDPSQIVVSQNGDDPNVARLISELNLVFTQNMLANVVHGEQRISQHYAFSIDWALKIFANSPALIILEDDLFVSPDFLMFFNFIAPQVESDDTVFAASAYNENGFKPLIHSKTKILRTDFFPGLGWLLLRSFWLNIRTEWPREHWDWFLRTSRKVISQDILYPEVSRVQHFGKKGTFMTEELHEKYFSNIAFNEDEEFKWEKKHFERLSLKAYKQNLAEILLNGHHLRSLHEINETQQKSYILWISCNPVVLSTSCEQLADKLGIWKQLSRGQKGGVHQIWFKNHKLLLMNIFNRKTEVQDHVPVISLEWLPKKPPNVPVFSSHNLKQLFR